MNNTVGYRVSRTNFLGSVMYCHIPNGESLTLITAIKLAVRTKRIHRDSEVNVFKAWLTAEQDLKEVIIWTI